MAYFLKKTYNKKGTYLQIYESYYDPERIDLINLSAMSMSSWRTVSMILSRIFKLRWMNSIGSITERKMKKRQRPFLTSRQKDFWDIFRLKISTTLFRRVCQDKCISFLYYFIADIYLDEDIDGIGQALYLSYCSIRRWIPWSIASWSRTIAQSGTGR